MNLESPKTYVLPLVTLLACAVECILFFVARPLALVFMLVVLLTVVHKRLDATVTFIPLYNTTIMTLVTFSFWFAWSLVVKDAYIENIVLRILHTIVLSGISLVSCIFFSNQFVQGNTRAAVFGGVIVVLGLVPVNLVTNIDSVTLFAQTFIYVFTVFLLFFVRLKKLLVVNTFAIFCFSLWILTTSQIVLSAMFLGTLTWSFVNTHGISVPDQPVAHADPELPPAAPSKKKILQQITKQTIQANATASLTNALTPVPKLATPALSFSINGLDD